MGEDEIVAERSIIIIGLPASGKTTFLAALWHLITEREVGTVLRFHNLSIGVASHLNRIAARWRTAKVQDRTALAGNKVVSMNLMDAGGTPVRVTFPDVPGEIYLRMWEERECDPEMARFLGTGDVIVFVHADRIQRPSWVVEEVALSKDLGLDAVENEVVSWRPSVAPTQVQLVDLLQMLRRSPLDNGPRRLAIMLSAWDKASGEGRSPQVYFQDKLPLLAQYLECGADDWTWRIYGLSAQGGEYDQIESGTECGREAEELRNLPCPSTRIRLLDGESETNDLTRPLAWLMEGRTASG